MERKKNKQAKLHIRKGDLVKVISGNAKGQQGRILKIITKDNKALVEGINIVNKHTKPTSAHPQGGIVKKEAPVHISNLMLIDPATGNPTKTGRKLNEKNTLARFSKKSGAFIKGEKK